MAVTETISRQEKSRQWTLQPFSPRQSEHRIAGIERPNGGVDLKYLTGQMELGQMELHCQEDSAMFSPHLSRPRKSKSSSGPRLVALICLALSCLKCPKKRLVDWCVADCLSGSRSERGCTPVGQFSRRPFRIGTRPSRNADTCRSTLTAREATRQALHIYISLYFAWPLNCVIIPVGRALKTENYRG